MLFLFLKNLWKIWLFSWLAVLLGSRLSARSHRHFVLLCSGFTSLPELDFTELVAKVGGTVLMDNNCYIIKVLFFPIIHDNKIILNYGYVETNNNSLPGEFFVLWGEFLVLWGNPLFFGGIPCSLGESLALFERRQDFWHLTSSWYD